MDSPNLFLYSIFKFSAMLPRILLNQPVATTILFLLAVQLFRIKSSRPRLDDLEVIHGCFLPFEVSDANLFPAALLRTNI